MNSERHRLKAESWNASTASLAAEKPYYGAVRATRSPAVALSCLRRLLHRTDLHASNCLSSARSSPIILRTASWNISRRTRCDRIRPALPEGRQGDPSNTVYAPMHSSSARPCEQGRPLTLETEHLRLSSDSVAALCTVASGRPSGRRAHPRVAPMSSLCPRARPLVTVLGGPFPPACAAIGQRPPAHEASRLYTPAAAPDLPAHSSLPRLC